MISLEPGQRVVFEWDFLGDGKNLREVAGRVQAMAYNLGGDPSADHVRVEADDGQRYIVPLAKVSPVAERDVTPSAIERIADALEWLCAFYYEAAEKLPGVWDVDPPARVFESPDSEHDGP